MTENVLAGEKCDTDSIKNGSSGLFTFLSPWLSAARVHFEFLLLLFLLYNPADGALLGLSACLPPADWTALSFYMLRIFSLPKLCMKYMKGFSISCLFLTLISGIY